MRLMHWNQTGNTRRAASLLATSLVGLMLLGGCKKSPTAEPGSPEATPSSAAPAPPASGAMTAAPQQSNPASGTAMTGPSQPPAADQAMTAAAPPPPPPPVVYTVPSGTRIVVRIGQTITEKGSNVGDRFRGSLAQSIRVSGVPVLKAGTPVLGTVVAVRKQGRFKGAGDLAIAVDTIGSRSVTTTSYEKTVSGKGKRSAGFIGGGAGGGALIGALAGGGKGALIGGLIGGGAGTAGAAFTGNANISIAAESVVGFSLTSPISITIQPRASGDETGEAPQQPGTRE